jgi:hypothetical protein
VLVEGGDWYYVKVDYRQNRGADVVPTAGLVLTTTLRANSTSETVNYDVTGAVRLGEDGTQKMLTALDVFVDQYFANAALLVAAIPAVLTLSDEPKLNLNAIECPNLFGSGTPLALAAREALYVNFEAEQVGDLFRLRHHLQIRRSWDWQGVELNADLTPVLSLLPQPVYEDANFVSVFDPA